MIKKNNLKERIEVLKIRNLTDNKTFNVFIEKIQKWLEEIDSSNDNTFKERINPYDFAKLYNLNRDSVISLFIYGVKIGLFDFEWNLICPKCGSIENHSNMSEINKKNFFCRICEIDVEIDMSDQVEISFRPSKEIYESSFQPWQTKEGYMTYYFSSNYIFPKETHKEAQKIMDQMYSDYVSVFPDESNKIIINIKEESKFRLLSLDWNLILYGEAVDNSDACDLIDLDLDRTGFSKKKITAKTGEITINIASHLPARAGFLCLLDKEKEIIEIKKKYKPPYFKPFFKGKDLLSNQVFRDTFRVETLPDDLNIKVGSLTLLFTDLKNSTILYDEAGDIEAYDMVKRHFDILKESISKHRGALIKTIGDAVMATFSTPEDGMAAALNMIEGINNFNSTFTDRETLIKIGLHKGTALAVNANDKLDFFGQTVNIAARIQGLADGGEILFSEDMFSSNLVKKQIRKYTAKLRRYKAELKGVSKPVTVYKIASKDKSFKRSQAVAV